MDILAIKSVRVPVIMSHNSLKVAKRNTSDHSTAMSTFKLSKQKWIHCFHEKDRRCTKMWLNGGVSHLTKRHVKQKRSVIKDKLHVKKIKGMESFAAILGRDVCSDLFFSGDISYMQQWSSNWVRHKEEQHARRKIKQLMNSEENQRCKVLFQFLWNLVVPVAKNGTNTSACLQDGEMKLTCSARQQSSFFSLAVRFLNASSQKKKF